MYPISDTQIAIMPTLDYYGYEHEDAITGGTGCFTEQGGPGVFVEMGCGWLWVFSCGWFGVEGEGGHQCHQQGWCNNCCGDHN